MLYVFHGTDRAESARKARSLIASLMKKRPDAAFEQISAQNWSKDLLEGHLGGQGLFSARYIVFLDRVTENELALETIPDFLEALKESANVFIMLEAKIKSDFSKAIEKHAEKVVVTDQKEKSFERSGADVFALSDAVGQKNPLKAWTLYREAIDGGIEPENIVGTIFWQIKSMVVSSKCGGAKESGLSPFVYSKAKKFSQNFSPSDLNKIMNEVVRIYHEGHRGMLNMELELEKMLLTRLV